MRRLAFILMAASALLGQSAPPMVYENPLADRLESARKSGLPSRQRAVAKPAEHRLGLLTEREQRTLATPSDRKRTGVHRVFNADLKTAGRWEGPGLWRVTITSPEARSVRLHLIDFHAGAGRLWVHDGAGDGAQVFGPWTGDGPWGDGDFWTDLVVGESLVLEYETSESARELPFRIAAVAHGAQLLSEKAQSTLGAAASCNLDVSCYPEWANTARAVGRYTFESDGSSYFCSGTLLNVPNTAATPYFLTADHCVSTATEARSVNIFWFYQTPACRGQAPNPRDLPRSNGSTYVTGTARPGGDMTLLRLNSVPSGVTFAGWTAEPPATGTRVTGIHHPSGDYKRISFATLRTANTRDADSYWGAYWDGGGLTEGGSSGSGLFLSDGRLVGTLSHGPKYDTAAEYCAALPFADNYGRLSAYYPLLRQYLEPGTTPPPPPPASGSGVLTSGVAAPFRIGPVTGGTLFNGASGFRVTVPAGATRLEVRLTTTTPNVDVDLYARFNQDVALSGGSVVSDHASEGAAGEEVIVITPASTPVLRAGTYYIGLGLFTNNVAVQGTVTATVTGAAPPPPPATGGAALTSGAARPFRLGPITGGASLYRGDNGYTIQVPAGATSLEIRVVTNTPGADVDLWARAGQDVGLESGRVVADYSSAGDTGNETIRITATSAPPLQPGTYYLALGLFTSNVTVEGTITATVQRAEPPPATGGSAVVLTSGVARSITLTPVTGPTLSGGASSFRIDVPAGAQRLEIRLSTPGRTDADVDLYARYGQAVSLSSGLVQSDHRSEGPEGEETILITPASAPPLRAGTYYVHFGIFTYGETINAVVTATVALRDTPPPPAQTGNLLTSGQARSYTLPNVTAPRLFTGESGFRIEVPAGATRLDVRLTTPNPAVDVDLYVRGLAEPALVSGRVAADGSSTGPDGNELVTISGGALRPGTYYVALALFTTGVDVNGTITATVTSESNSSVTLTSGVPARFRIGPVTTETLFAGTRGFRVTVPEGAARLELRLATDTAGADVDLYARAASDVTVEGGRIVSDFASEGLTGSEVIVITPGSDPALRPGTYFVALGLFTNNLEATGTVTATVTNAGPATNSGGALLTPGVPSKFSFGPVTSPTLYNGENSFRVVVPDGTSRLEIRMTSETPSVDTDLYVRRDADVELADGQAVADYESSSSLGNEVIVVQGAALRPGTYYASVGLFTRNAVARGSLLATLTRGGVSSAPLKKERLDELSPKIPLKKLERVQPE